MKGGLQKVLVVLALATLFPCTAAATVSPDSRVEIRFARMQAQLDAEAEARDRQADAFDAAVARIEFVNGALVAVLALAGIGGSLLAMRWVRKLAHDQVAAQIDSAIRKTGEDIFEKDSQELRDEYEEKFTHLYREYQNLLEKQ